MTTREEIAQIIYGSFPFNATLGQAHKPEWVTNGNSLMQEEARHCADKILALSPPEPTDTNRAENILREFEELHGQITIDERKWLRDRIATEITPPEPTEGQIEAARINLDAFYKLCKGRERTSNDDAAWGQFDSAARYAWPLISAALRAMPLQQRVAGQWSAGAPPMPWSEEWFIAETTFGDRVVLRSLPTEWTYDFKTADDTYIKADKIKRWMQFPDSQFVGFVAPAPAMIAEQQTEEQS